MTRAVPDKLVALLKVEFELRHDRFMARVPGFLKDHLQFKDIFFDSYGRPQPGYNFPRPESTMSLP